MRRMGKKDLEGDIKGGGTMFVIITFGVTCGNLASKYVSVCVASVLAEREAKEVIEEVAEEGKVKA